MPFALGYQSDMRGYLIMACALLLTACGGQGGAGAQAHPDGWQSKGGAWIDPQDPRQRFASTSKQNAANLTLGDLASQVTTDMLLSNKGARMLRADRYPGCPGEAGLQTFAVRAPGETEVLRVAFTQWNGTIVTTTYRRPSAALDDPAAVTALTRSVCSAVAGTPTLPPIPR
jgi:hypothetical protein